MVHLPQGSSVCHIIIYTIYNIDTPKISFTTQTTYTDDTIIITTNKCILFMEQTNTYNINNFSIINGKS